MNIIITDVLTHNDAVLISTQKTLVIFTVTFRPAGIHEATANADNNSCRRLLPGCATVGSEEVYERVFHFISQRRGQIFWDLGICFQTNQKRLDFSEVFRTWFPLDCHERREHRVFDSWILGLYLPGLPASHTEQNFCKPCLDFRTSCPKAVTVLQ